MSMYKDYVENQLPNRFVHETSKGFATYNIKDKACQIEEVYIKPEFRRQGAVKELTDFVENDAKSYGCNHLIGTIVIGTAMAEESCLSMLKYGYKFWYTDGIIVYFKKDIGE